MSDVKIKTGMKVVYPPHGVGRVSGIQEQHAAGQKFSAYHIAFDDQKMTVHIPVDRAHRSGLRVLSSANQLEKVRKVLKMRPKAGRGMWSRRAKEYETKINSGDIVSLAEVVRDLHKNIDNPERSYSERAIYENALNRLAAEFSAIENIDLQQAAGELVGVINDNQPSETSEELLDEGDSPARAA